MSFELYLVLFFVVSFFLTGALRVYALKKNVMDIPNERSSHAVPTPRGGGVSVVITFLCGLVLVGLLGYVSTEITTLLFTAGLMVALVGWFDDHGHVSAKWRLLVHFLAAFIVVYACDGLPVLSFMGWDLSLGWAGHFLTGIALVWILNLYNFMDGIDGLAGGQSVISTSVMGVLLFFVYDQPGFANLHWLFAACSLGFLLWNFPIAKIFMGDAGSGFIGIMLGAFLLISSHVDQSLFWAWLIMLAVFITDASYTLIVRFLRGEKIHDAHCNHAYQHATRKLKSHKIVTLSVYVINIVWLAPIALSVSMYKIDGLLGLIIAVVPLLFYCHFFKAGSAASLT
ncbi:MAG: glycosyltransferase family 4 protein [Oceanospirillaceae bacterium]|nr:glycosyltransferase family 4 protein [Colwellia sp.]NQZ32165.1 glycosyltransferase family 4 protein [Oceanospirillaceae bacterium]